MAFSTRYMDEYVTEVRIDIGCPGGGSLLWETSEIERCVQRAVDDLSRHYPMEEVYEHTIVQTVTNEASVAPAVATMKALTYKPIKPESEVITNAAGTTTYVRDTDYTMDYINGEYTIISTGSITAADNLLVDYKKDMLGIDVATLITDMIRVVWVEYPAGHIPQKKAAFSIWEDFMHVGSQVPGESQKELTDKEHVVIYYEKVHTAPLVSTVASFPAFLDEVICKGAAAYCFLNKAVNTEHQCVVDLAAVRAACVNAVKYQNNNTDADAAGILADITSDKAFLRDAIHATGAPNTGALFEANELLLEVSSIDLDAATVGAVAWLLEGELLINQLNDGKNVPENFADYARAKIQIAQARTMAASGLIQESATRLSNLRTYLEQAVGYNRISEGFLVEAAQYQQVVANNMLLADRFRAEGQIRMAEFNGILASRAESRKRITSVPVRQPA